MGCRYHWRGSDQVQSKPTPTLAKILSSLTRFFHFPAIPLTNILQPNNLWETVGYDRNWALSCAGYDSVCVCVSIYSGQPNNQMDVVTSWSHYMSKDTKCAPGHFIEGHWCFCEFLVIRLSEAEGEDCPLGGSRTARGRTDQNKTHLLLLVDWSNSIINLHQQHCCTHSLSA